MKQSKDCAMTINTSSVTVYIYLAMDGPSRLEDKADVFNIQRYLEIWGESVGEYPLPRYFGGLPRTRIKIVTPTCPRLKSRDGVTDTLQLGRNYDASIWVCERGRHEFGVVISN